jgi:hypothetical protein
LKTGHQRADSTRTTIKKDMAKNNIGWDDVPDKFIKLDIDDTAKCFCCGGWFPLESCVVNHDEEHKAVPVCETCAEGRVG